VGRCTEKRPGTRDKEERMDGDGDFARGLILTLQ
jgi:hypothetical protein